MSPTAADTKSDDEPEPLPLERWRLGSDDRDEVVIVGLLADGSLAGGPLSRLDRERRLARTRDGTLYRLRTSDPTVADDPWRLPAATEARRLKRLQVVLTRLRSGDRPSAMELRTAPLLAAWTVTIGTGLPVLAGIVQGHPRIADGAWITTSPVIWISADRTAARTVSRWYRLGAPLSSSALPTPS